MALRTTRFILTGLAVSAALAGGVWLLLVRGSGQLQHVDDELVVATTIFPLADIAQHVGGEHVAVRLIIPPGVSEHSHALTPRQLQELQPARALFYIGHGLDDRLVDRITAAVPAARAVAVDHGIALRKFGDATVPDEHATEEPADADEEEHAHDTGTDPHYWLTLPNASTMAATIAAELAALDPEHTEDFARNLAAYQAELEKAETALQATARELPRKEFIALHDAWSYFAAQYGLELVATYEPVEGREPSLRDLQRLQDIIADHAITTFFTEPQKASSAVTDFVQREFGLRVLQLDPVGGRAGAGSYLELMHANMQAIVQGAQ